MKCYLKINQCQQITKAIDPGLFSLSHNKIQLRKLWNFPYKNSNLVEIRTFNNSLNFYELLYKLANTFQITNEN